MLSLSRPQGRRPPVRPLHSPSLPGWSAATPPAPVPARGSAAGAGALVLLRKRRLCAAARACPQARAPRRSRSLPPPPASRRNLRPAHSLPPRRGRLRPAPHPTCAPPTRLRKRHRPADSLSGKSGSRTPLRETKCPARAPGPRRRGACSPWVVAQNTKRNTHHGGSTQQTGRDPTLVPPPEDSMLRRALRLPLRGAPQDLHRWQRAQAHRQVRHRAPHRRIFVTQDDRFRAWGPRTSRKRPARGSVLFCGAQRGPARGSAN